MTDVELKVAAARAAAAWDVITVQLEVRTLVALGMPAPLHEIRRIRDRYRVEIDPTSGRLSPAPRYVLWNGGR